MTVYTLQVPKYDRNKPTWIDNLASPANLRPHGGPCENAASPTSAKLIAGVRVL